MHGHHQLARLHEDSKERVFQTCTTTHNEEIKSQALEGKLAKPIISRVYGIYKYAYITKIIKRRINIGESDTISYYYIKKTSSLINSNMSQDQPTNMHCTSTLGNVTILIIIASCTAQQ